METVGKERSCAWIHTTMFGVYIGCGLLAHSNKFKFLYLENCKVTYGGKSMNLRLNKWEN